MLKRALILDRDGVINVDRGYVYLSDDIEFIPGIFDLCRTARSLEMPIVVVTNQAGIGRGFYSPSHFEALCGWMQSIFEAEEAPLTRIYHCPYHPEHGVGLYRVDSEDRKPNPGMILKAQKDLGLDLGASVMVGDRETDMQAGLRAGVGIRILLDPTNEAAIGSSTKKVTNLRDIIALLHVLGRPDPSLGGSGH